MGRLIQFRPENGTNVTATRYTVLFNKEAIGTVRPAANGILLFEADFSLNLEDLGWVAEKVRAFFLKQSQYQVN